MLDESDKRVINDVLGLVAYNNGIIKRTHDYPIDGMPVSVQEIAYYRNALLAALKDHNETCGRVERLLTAGGKEVIDLWCEVYNTEEVDGCDSGICAPRPDGNPEG